MVKYTPHHLEAYHTANKHFAKTHTLIHKGLETPLLQLHYFDKLSAQEQELFLLDALVQTQDKTYANALKSWYKQGRAEGFVALQKQFASPNKAQQALDAKLINGLILERNKRFLLQIQTLLETQTPQSYFFAIGAGHLADAQGLVAKLKALGYQVKPIP